LFLTKRRLYCKPCKKPFTEPVPGVRKGRRTTERYRAELLWACENYTDLKRVKNKFRCSSGFLYRALYEQLHLRLKKRQYPWPKVIGIDEHSFRRTMGRCHYASLIVDYSNKKIFEVVEGKTGNELLQALQQIENPENVEKVVLDLCDPFKNFARAQFPKAILVADKFHVLRLLTPALNRRRKAIVGDRRTARIGRLLLRNGYRLDYFTRKVIWQWLDLHPELKEIYRYKERLHGFYRTRGYDKARAALDKLTWEMQSSALAEVQTLRRTLIKWQDPILNYFKTGLTNGRTEGYNNLAKLIQKRAFGYKSFANYRLRLLNACA
jgi:transposase